MYGRAIIIITHLGIEGVLKYFAQSLGVLLRLSGLCGIEDGRLDALSQGLAHHLRRELHCPGRYNIKADICV